jgi:hypothetical protein
MNHKVKIIKRSDRKEKEVDRLQQPGPPSSREISATIKLWVSEFKQRTRPTNVSNPRRREAA